MGQKSKQASPDVNLKLASMMVPIDLLNFFDIHQVHEKPNEWQIVLVEKEHLIPNHLKALKMLC